MSLDKYLADRGIKKRWIARKVGISDTSIHLYAKGSEPKLGVAKKMADVLGVSLDKFNEIFFDDGIK